MNQPAEVWRTRKLPYSTRVYCTAVKWDSEGRKWHISAMSHAFMPIFSRKQKHVATRL